MLYPLKFYTRKFLYIAIPIKINIISVVEKGLNYYIFVRRVSLFIIRIRIIYKYNIIIISNKGSQKKIIIIIIGRYQEFWGLETLKKTLYYKEIWCIKVNSRGGRIIMECGNIYPSGDIEMSGISGIYRYSLYFGYPLYLSIIYIYPRVLGNEGCV